MIITTFPDHAYERPQAAFAGMRSHSHLLKEYPAARGIPG